MQVRTEVSTENFDNRHAAGGRIRLSSTCKTAVSMLPCGDPLRGISIVVELTHRWSP